MQISPISQDGFQALDSSCPDSDRLHVFSGNLFRSIQLFAIPTFGSTLMFSLYHNSTDIGAAGEVGIGWRHSLEARLTRASSSADLVEYTDESGRRRDFERVDGKWRLKDNSLFSDLTLTELGNGSWQLVREPDLRTWEFVEQGGSPIVARLSRVLDSSSNEIQYVLNGSNQVVQILQPVSNQAITLEWVDGKLSAVEDMEENRYALTYTDDRLTALEMPGGCLIDFTYDTNDRVESRTSQGAITSYTYDTQGRLTQIEGPLEGASRPTATWSYSPDPVNEVANLSPVC